MLTVSFLSNYSGVRLDTGPQVLKNLFPCIVAEYLEGTVRGEAFLRIDRGQYLRSDPEFYDYTVIPRLVERCLVNNLLPRGEMQKVLATLNDKQLVVIDKLLAEPRKGPRITVRTQKRGYHAPRVPVMEAKAIKFSLNGKFPGLVDYHNYGTNLDIEIPENLIPALNELERRIAWDELNKARSFYISNFSLNPFKITVIGLFDEGAVFDMLRLTTTVEANPFAAQLVYLRMLALLFSIADEMGLEYKRPPVYYPSWS